MTIADFLCPEARPSKGPMTDSLPPSVRPLKDPYERASSFPGWRMQISRTVKSPGSHFGRPCRVAHQFRAVRDHYMRSWILFPPLEGRRGFARLVVNSAL